MSAKTGDSECACESDSYIHIRGGADRCPYRGYFAQHHVDTLTATMNPVQFLASKFPGKTEQEYRQHLGNFQISGMTG